MAYELLNNVHLSTDKPCAVTNILHFFAFYLNADIIVYGLEGGQFTVYLLHTEGGGGQDYIIKM